MADDLNRAGVFSGHKSPIVEQSPRASETVRSQIPNALSVLRFVLAAGWVELAAAGHQGRGAYLAIAVLAAASDFIDGRIARRLGVATSAGRWLDGVADVTFVLAAIFSSAAAGAIPYYVPVLIAISFSQYVIDSILISRTAAGPIKSRLGHWGGIINYALVIALAVTPGPADSSAFASFRLVGDLLRAIAPLLALFYAGAIVERAMTYRRRHGTRDVPD